jgi:alginate O-acetyltransferase complex protein AlgI
MIFTSDVYVVFLLVVFALHWLLPSAARRPFLIAASYVFYASWSWKYLALLLSVSLFNWAYARWVLARSERGAVLGLGILVNVAVLVYFKYTRFLIDNLHGLSATLGAHWALPAVNILLPLGVSFFTFQGIAYLVDVASGDELFTSLRDFLLFKGFWPQLIAGPITRVSEMRDQIEVRRTRSNADFAAGARRIVIGFNKKLVLADSISPLVEKVFAAGAAPTGLDALIGTAGFALQIYFDFSAYSDIAIGTARLFGFVFPENFAWPYGAASPQEFWNRWHMTLSRWIRDYVFTPLSFAFRRQPRVENLWLIVAMTICGLWHGANWTFVVWGLWHGVLLALNRTVLKGGFDRATRGTGGVRVAGVAVTFTLVNVGWVFFRAANLPQAFDLLAAIATLRGGPHLHVLGRFDAALVPGIVAALALADLARLPAANFARRLGERPWFQPVRPLADVALVHLAILFGGAAKPFVYFRF